MTITSGEFKYIRDLVRDHSALMLEPGKEYLVESRLDPLVRHEGLFSLQGLVERLRSAPFCDLHRRVVEAMTNNETLFFRDARVFRMFMKSVLPALAARRASERSLSIWCAACSTGQEPYSVAMALREHLPSFESWNITLIASDISRDVLVRARAGRYNQIEVNRGLPANLLVKYFSTQGAAWEISPEIRRMVQFRETNLMHPWSFLPRMDIIFMRNVLIYFDLAAKKTILGRISRSLAPGGYLFLGGAETTMNLDDSFDYVSHEGSVCFRLKSKDACAAPTAS